MASATPYVFSSALHSHLTPYLAALHAHCVTHDDMGGTFRPPLSHEKLLAWWKGRIAEVDAGARLMLILLDESEPGAKAKGTELKGVVLLAVDPAETSQHAAALEMLLVQADYRGRGAARNLVTALEYEALQRGKTLLRLEVESGSVAETVFHRLGYHEVGKIPGYSVTGRGPAKDETIFYKVLASV